MDIFREHLPVQTVDTNHVDPDLAIGIKCYLRIGFNPFFNSDAIRTEHSIHIFDALIMLSRIPKRFYALI